MTAKQVPGRTAPDGSEYVTLVDGAGNLSPASGGGGGGAVTIADGAAVTLGTTTDAKNTATDTTAVTAISVLKQISASIQAPPSQAVTQATASNLNATVKLTDGTNIATVKAASTAPVATDTAAVVSISPNSIGLITTGTAGSASAQVVTVQGVASMTPVQVSQSAVTSGGYSFLNIAAGQATTIVKSGAGTLHSIVLNSAATATNVTTVYDNTAGSGTVIAIPAVTTATVPVSLIFDIAFATGLTIVTATANGGNMTICYK